MGTVYGRNQWLLQFKVRLLNQADSILDISFIIINNELKASCAEKNFLAQLVLCFGDILDGKAKFNF